MAYSTKHAVNEATYAVRRSGRYIGGQVARTGLRFLTAMGAAIAGVSGNAGFFYASGLIGVGTGVGLQAWLNHKDYEHNKEQLASMYSKEINSFFAKGGRGVTVQDIEALGNYNSSIKEHLDREKTTRDVRTGIWLVSSVLGFVAASALVGAVGVAAPLAAIAGFSTFLVSRPIVKSMGEQMYKLNEPTTVEIVKSLEWKRTKGQNISRAQVMEVFVSASPQLEQMIERSFGKGFMQLDVGDQHRVMNQFGERIRLEEVTQAINENRMNARELTFRVHGQVSGAYPDPTYKEQWSSGISQVKEKARSVQKNVKNVGGRAMAGVNQFMGRSQSDQEPAVGEAPETKWQDMENARRAERGTTQQGI